MVKNLLIALSCVLLFVACSQDGKKAPEEKTAADTTAPQLSDSTIHEIFNNKITQEFNESPTTAIQVIQNSVIARFGKRGMADIKNIYMELRIRNGEMGADSKIWMKMPDKMRTESVIAEKKGIAVFTQNNSWLKAPDSNAVISPSKEEAMQMKFAAVTQLEYILSPISSLMKKPYDIELAGKEIIDGKEHFVVKFSNPTAKKQKAEAYDEHIVFINAKTFIDSKIITYVTIKGKTHAETTILSDNRNVGGYTIAHRIVSANQSMKVVNEIKLLKLNEPIDDALFTKSSIK